MHRTLTYRNQSSTNGPPVLHRGGSPESTLRQLETEGAGEIPGPQARSPVMVGSRELTGAWNRLLDSGRNPELLHDVFMGNEIDKRVATLPGSLNRRSAECTVRETLQKTSTGSEAPRGWIAPEPSRCSS